MVILLDFKNIEFDGFKNLALKFEITDNSCMFALSYILIGKRKPAKCGHF